MIGIYTIYSHTPKPHEQHHPAYTRHGIIVDIVFYKFSGVRVLETLVCCISTDRLSAIPPIMVCDDDDGNRFF